MSELNSAKQGSGGSINISIAKARQNRDSALLGSATAEAARENAITSASGSSAPIPTPTGCSFSRECAEGWACIDGTCTDMSGSGSDRINSPGDCELPDDQLAKNPCGKPGGCEKPTCGENLDKGGIDCCGGTIYRGFVTERIGTDPETLEPVTRQVWKEQCEPLSYECDQYADFWYKATGDLLSGYETSQICNSCNECAEGKICRPISEAFAPCYCWPGICKDKEGPCFDCDSDTGDCNETCTGCVAECNQYFTCPCDPAQDRYEATGSFNPCTSTSGGCWEPTAEKIRTFCEETFPCADEDQCKGNCETLKGTSGYPGCPEGKICTQNGFIQNADTGTTTYFVRACDTKSDCGCAAPPNSPLYQACGECEVCENGSCVRDPQCGQIFDDGGGYWYDPEGWHFERLDWVCAYCDPQPYEGQCNSGTSHIDYQGGDAFSNCRPGDPFCKYNDPATNSGRHKLLNQPLYSDGIFTIALGSDELSWNAICGPEADGTTQSQIGSYSWQRLVDIVDDYSMSILYQRLLVTYTRGYFVTTGNYASGRRGQPVKVTSFREVLRVRKSATGSGRARLKLPKSSWQNDLTSNSDYVSYEVVEINENWPLAPILASES